MARPTRIDSPEFVKNFAELIRGGFTITAACEAIGIADSTYRTWRRQAEGDLAAGNTDTAHARFLTAVQEAKRQAERYAIAGILRAGLGDQSTETTTITKTYTKVVAGELHEVSETTTKTVERTDKQWQALAWWLERNYPERYARVTRQWVSGPDEGPVEVSSPDEMRDRLNRDLDALAVSLLGGGDDEDPLDVPSDPGVGSV